MGKGKLRLLFSVAFVFVLALGLVAAPAIAQPVAKTDVLIGFTQTPGAAEEGLVRGAGGVIKYTFHLVPVIAASVPEAAIRGLERNPNVAYVEEDGVVCILDELADSWGVDRIDADLAWGTSKGFGVHVSIVDTGIDKDHEDLIVNIADGVNFIRIRGKINPDAWDDDNGHGTHCAGIVAADDNGIGVIGVAPDASLYGVKVLDSRGSGKWSDVIKGIEWSVDGPDGVRGNEDDAEVISMSLGGGYSESVEAACDAAYATGLLLVAAAGNEYGGGVIYPAACDSVVAVSATDKSDNLASFSSVGPQVELAAPGVDIYSTYKDGGYTLKSGTSMSCPHVSGAAALVWATGAYASGSAVRTQLDKTAEDIGLTPEEQGYGLVDAEKAVLGTTAGDDLAIDTTAPVISDVADSDITASSAAVTWATDEPSDSVVNYGATTALGSQASDATMVTSHSVSLTDLTADTTYYYEVQSTDGSGNTAVDNNGGAYYSFTTKAAAPALSVTVLTDASYTIGDTVDITVIVTDADGLVVSGASVYVEVITGRGAVRYTGDGTTDAEGKAYFQYTIANRDGTGTYTVTADALHPDYESGSGSTTFEVMR